MMTSSWHPLINDPDCGLLRLTEGETTINLLVQRVAEGVYKSEFGGPTFTAPEIWRRLTGKEPDGV